MPTQDRAAPAGRAPESVQTIKLAVPTVSLSQAWFLLTEEKSCPLKGNLFFLLMFSVLKLV